MPRHTTDKHPDLRAGLEKIYADLPRRHRQATIESTLNELSAVISERNADKCWDANKGGHRD